MAETEKNVKLDVRAYPITEPKGGVVAFASVTIDEMFAVNNLRVVNSDKGLFVAMPQARDNRGNFRDICFPVTAELRQQLSDAVLGAYEQVLQEKVNAVGSTLDQLRAGKNAAKEQSAQAQTAQVKAAKKAGPEL